MEVVLLENIKNLGKVGDIVKVGFDAARCHLFDRSKQAFK